MSGCMTGLPIAPQPTATWWEWLAGSAASKRHSLRKLWRRAWGGTSSAEHAQGIRHRLGIALCWLLCWLGRSAQVWGLQIWGSDVRVGSILVHRHQVPLPWLPYPPEQNDLSLVHQSDTSDLQQSRQNAWAQGNNVCLMMQITLPCSPKQQHTCRARHLTCRNGSSFPCTIHANYKGLNHKKQRERATYREHWPAWRGPVAPYHLCMRHANCQHSSAATSVIWEGMEAMCVCFARRTIRHLLSVTFSLV